MKYVRKTKADLTYVDIEEIRSLLEALEVDEREGYKEVGMPQYSQAWVREYSGNDLIVVIDDEGSNKIIGLIDYHVNDNICTMNELIVDSNYRRQGVAQELYTNLKNYLTTYTWVDEVKLSVRANNDAIKFYKSIGFKTYQIEMCCKLM
jgi:ribosomal protein S18 acetylase RimI-like enzyme